MADRGAAAATIHRAYGRYRHKAEFNTREVPADRVHALVRDARARDRGMLLLLAQLLFIVLLISFQASYYDVAALYDVEQAHLARLNAIDGMDDALTHSDAWQWLLTATSELYDEEELDRRRLVAAQAWRADLIANCPVPAEWVPESCVLDSPEFRAVRLMADLGALNQSCPIVDDVQLAPAATNLSALPCHPEEIALCGEASVDFLDRVCVLYAEELRDECSCIWTDATGQACAAEVAAAQAKLWAAGYCEVCAGDDYAAWVTPSSMLNGMAVIRSSRYATDGAGRLLDEEDGSGHTGYVTGRDSIVFASDDLPITLGVDLGQFGFYDMNLCTRDIAGLDGYVVRQTKQMELALGTVNLNHDMYTLVRAGFEPYVSAHAISFADRVSLPLFVLLWLSVAAMAGAEALEIARRRRFSLQHWAAIASYAVTLGVWKANNDRRTEFSPVYVDVVDGDTLDAMVADFDELSGFIRDDALARTLSSVCMLQAIAQCIERFRFHHKVSLVTRTLERAFEDLMHFGVFLVCVWVTFSFLAHQMVGHHIEAFATYTASLEAMLFLAIGEIDPVSYEDVAEIAPVLGEVMIWTYIVLVTLLSLNIFLAIVVNAFDALEDSPGAESFFRSVGLSLRSLRRHGQLWYRQQKKVVPGPAPAGAPYLSSASPRRSVSAADKIVLTRSVREQLRDEGVSAAAIGQLVQRADSTRAQPETEEEEQARMLREIHASVVVGSD